MRFLWALPKADDNLTFITSFKVPILHSSISSLGELNKGLLETSLLSNSFSNAANRLE